jgi:hypothetical protein
MTNKDLLKLSLVEVSQIQDMLDGAPESGDIEHQIDCHREDVPELLRRYASIIENLKEFCSDRVWKYLESLEINFTKTPALVDMNATTPPKLLRCEGEAMAPLVDDELDDSTLL